jgi:hypothetical protein
MPYAEGHAQQPETEPETVDDADQLLAEEQVAQLSPAGIDGLRVVMPTGVMPVDPECP